MGILSEDFIDTEFVKLGSLFEVKSISTPNTMTHVLGGYGFGLIPMLIGNPHMVEMKQMVSDLPMVVDYKKRFRIDKQALIDFTIMCYTGSIRKQLVTADIRVTISSINDDVYYVVYTNNLIVDDRDDYINQRLLQIVLKERK